MSPCPDTASDCRTLASSTHDCSVSGSRSSQPGSTDSLNHAHSCQKDSRSSRLFRVKVYDEHGSASRTGAGIFRREMMKRFPLSPMEEGHLNDMPLRENLVECVFAYRRWTELLDEDPTPGGLVRFHTAHKLTLMARSPRHYTEMGRLVAKAGTIPRDDLSATCGRLFMEGLGLLDTRRKHVNVHQHLMGCLKSHLSAEDEQHVLGLIEDCRQGLVPPTVPLSLLKHQLQSNAVPHWVWQQVYLNPYPEELMLRNHV